jgi:putative heme-binding domain-containing protein
MRSAVVALLAAVCLLKGAEDAEKGRAIYRSNCAFCHGLTGLGGRGPDLVSRRKPDAEIRRIIREGIPGSTMPSFGGFEEHELNNVTAFIRLLAGSGSAPDAVKGDATRGRTLYTKLACAGCHQIGTDGSAYGPDLTRIGSARPVHYLRESLTEPSADIPTQYEGVRVVTRQGTRVQGVRVNEDTFSVQLRDGSQKFRSFLKEDVKEVAAVKESLMPAYRQLPGKDLDDLVAYLASLRGEASGSVKQAEGIR